LKKIALIVSAIVAFTAIPALSNARTSRVDGVFDVSAYNYGFNGVQKRVDAGEYKFNFQNRSGKRVHEFVLLRNTSKMKPRHIIRLSYRNEDKALSKVEFKGATFAEPGKDGDAFKADLTPGQYFYACFVQNSNKSTPHWKLGMFKKFRVQ
jgi:uncharacterized cupredoxin-like copper-binding protein